VIALTRDKYAETSSIFAMRIRSAIENESESRLESSNERPAAL
jgi:hypothetical protein